MTHVPAAPGAARVPGADSGVQTRIPRSMLTVLTAAAERQTARRRKVCPPQALALRAEQAPPPRDFRAAVTAPGLGVIAELKRRSPSKGTLTRHFRPQERARAYERGGACAISVLTHEEGFGGSPEHLRLLRSEVSVPLLRKDFVTDPYQVLEARALGADAVLLIAAAVPVSLLGELLDQTHSLGMQALVEVHDENDTERALAVDAPILGVNHRDLRTFTMDAGRTERLRGLVGPERVLVGESGVRDADDAARLRAAGADAILVGETLMRAADPAAMLRELRRT